MTKTAKILIAGISIILIMTLVFIAINLGSSSGKIDSQLQNYYAQRNDLISEQQKIQGMISDLNSTLTAEARKNAQLSQQLSNLNIQKAALAQALNATQSQSAVSALQSPPSSLSVNTLPPPQPVYTLPPASVPVVTRAS